MEMSESLVSRDELVVLKLLEEIERLVELAGGESQADGDADPRMHPAAKLYLDTRDTFEAIEKLVEAHVRGKPKFLRKLSQKFNGWEESSDLVVPRTSDVEETLNTAILDRIQELFRHLGCLLGPSILKELKLRKLSILSILHYVRFLPMKYQWIAYKEARKEEVALVYREAVFNSLAAISEISPTLLQTDRQVLRQRADFVKQQLRQDVDTICLVAPDNTLTTIFDDEDGFGKEDVAIKLESLIQDVYSKYLTSTVETQMNLLTHISDQWTQDQVAALSSLGDTASPLVVQCFHCPRKFQSKEAIFPEKVMGIVTCYANLRSGQPLTLLVADASHVGVWYQKTVHSVSEGDVTTIYDDKSHAIFGKLETLDGQLYVPIVGRVGDSDGSRLFTRRGSLAKRVNQRALVNNGKDSVWIEVVITEVDDKRCKLQVKKSLQKCQEIASWLQLLARDEWMNLRDLRFMGIPVNRNFREHMGLKFHKILDSIDAMVVEITSVLPQGELHEKVGYALWKSMEASISKGEHIFARYFRSILQDDGPPQVSLTARSVSMIKPNGNGNGPPDQDNSSEVQARGTEYTRRMSPGVPLRRRSSVWPVVQDGAGYFDESGVYCTRRSTRLGRGSLTLRVGNGETTPSARILSPCEKLAHHLLEETEMVGTCIQAQNVALSCAFVQVVLEKMAKMTGQLQTGLQLPSCTIECILLEHANACRLLYVWKMCRHQVDTKMPRHGQKEEKDTDESRFIHLEWATQAFEKVETQIEEMIHSLAFYVHHRFFHECITSLLPGLYEQPWTANRPWFGNTRCSYAVQGLIFRMQLVVQYVNTTVLVDYPHQLGVHDKIYELTTRMILDVLIYTAEAYESLEVSRARQVQWKIDILYLVSGVYKVLKQLNRMLALGSTSSGKNRAMNNICSLCLRLLTRLGIRSGPVFVVLDTVKNQISTVSSGELVPMDLLSELECHVVSIFDKVYPKGERITGEVDSEEGGKTLRRIYSVFGSAEIKKLAEVELNWALLISRHSLSTEMLMEALQQRHELGNWAFPALTETELQARDDILQFFNQASNANTQNQLGTHHLDQSSATSTCQEE